jgi:hypothetical protein
MTDIHMIGMEFELAQQPFVKNCYTTFNKNPMNHMFDNITSWKNRRMLPPHKIFFFYLIKNVKQQSSDKAQLPVTYLIQYYHH